MRTRQVLDALGDGNAENERNFDRIFVETHDYRAVADTSRSLVLGGRSAGKSAIFRMLASQTSDDASSGSSSLAQTLEPDPSSWRVFERAANAARDDVQAISRQWELSILLHCFEAGVSTSTKGAKRRRLVSELNTEIDNLLNRDLLREDPKGRMSMFFSAAVSMLQDLPFKIKFSAPYSPISLELKDKEVKRDVSPTAEDERRGVVLIEGMYSVLGSLLHGNATVRILIDQLDEHWRGQQHQVASLCGLLTAVMRVTRVVTQRGLDDLITFSVFLRSDIYEILKRNGLNDASKYRRHELHLRWNDGSLRAMLDKRIASAGVEELTQFRDLFTDEKLGSRRLDEYLLATAVPRPRDTIQFLAMCLDNAVARNSEVISRDDVRYAEATYSTWRRDVILEEARYGYDNVDGLLESFGSRGSTYEPGALNKHLDSVKREYDIRTTKPTLTDALVDWGVLGVRSGKGRPQYIWDVPPGQRVHSRGCRELILMVRR